MSYLIDGHNLIPKLGISLQEMDDEKQLIDILQRFSNLSRRKIEVFFDKASPGQGGTRHFGLVTAHFIPIGTAADEAILKRLQSLSKAASSWIVVSSDHHVQIQAKALHARVVSSEKFSQSLNEIRDKKNKDAEPTSQDGDDIQEWMRLFGE